MLVIAGLSVLLVAGITTIVDRVPLRARGHGYVPLRDHGRRGGAARTERALDWRPTHRGHNARRAAAHMAFTNRARDTRLQHQQRADQGNFALDRTVNQALPI